MSTKAKDFHDIRNSLYSRAELFWTLSVAANALAVGASLVALVSAPSGSLAVGAALAALACPAVSVFLREAAVIPMDRGDTIRQLILLSDSLGQPIPAAEQAKVRRWVPHAALGPAPYISPYYASKRKPGPARLADNLAESAYFTEHLAEKLAVAFGLVAGLALALLVGGLYVVSSSVTTSSALPLFAKGAVTVIVFFVSGDCGVLAWRFVRLKLAAESAFKNGCALRDNPKASIAEALPMLLEYEAARIQSPPIPFWLHKRNMAELNDDYRESHGA